MKKIIPSICMLLVTAVLMGTSTYAWFSMNKEVKAEGMKVSASTSANLIISESKITQFDGTKNEYTINFNKDNTYKVLTPVSSADGKKFFTADKTADKPNKPELLGGAAFVLQENATSGTAITYWVEKSAHIGVKGVTDLGKLSVNISAQANNKKDVTVTEEAKKIYKALRFAVYYKAEGEGAAASDSVIFSGDLDGIKTARTWKGAIEAKDVTAADATTQVTTKIGATEIPGIEELKANTDYEIRIVVWLEGQDDDCFADNTNAAAAIFNGLDVSFIFTAAEKAA